MSKYELMYIIDPTLEETARKELIDRFTQVLTSNGAEIDKVDEWGKRRLAYTIDYKNEGYYVLITFSAGPDVPREIERNLQISESILRYLVVKLEQKRTSVKPRPAPLRPVAQPAAPATMVVEVIDVPVETQAPAAAAEEAATEETPATPEA